ncbi:C4b-binding protein alpha chain-like [Talpa occidentalis]|uniref:C4b-binding protein alpha chain-like n=1 Tax=Talpa occidentalis TaxID=50954 RepID=UPI00188FD473|nr:C4b-binding protein alpha chain-like [Talpa occidentalis]
MAPMPWSLWPALCLWGAVALLLCPAAWSDCSAFPSIEHGSSEDVSSFLSFTTVLQYQCDEGYALVGEARLSCRSAVWSSPAPWCRAQCRRPEIEHGSLSADKEQYMELEEVTVQCDCGYHMAGSPRIICSENRTWSPELPKCEWEVAVGCDQIVAGRKLLQCLPSPEDVRTALEVYKLSLEIKRLEQA